MPLFADALSVRRSQTETKDILTLWIFCQGGPRQHDAIADQGKEKEGLSVEEEKLTEAASFGLPTNRKRGTKERNPLAPKGSHSNVYTAWEKSFLGPSD